MNAAFDGKGEPLDTHAKAEHFVNSILPAGVVLKVLDIKAATQRFEIRDPIYVVGVDVVQAERGVRRDADEHRVMDLEAVDLESEEYDVVLCINVLEHARQPLLLFDEVWKALKSGGRFVIVLPNVASVKGVVTRLFPWALTRWFYGTILRADAHPARAVHSSSLRPSSLLAHARSGGWTVDFFRTYEGPVQRSTRERLRIVGWRWRAVVALTRLATLGLLSADETGIVAVLTKTPFT
jgi:SAM-dependent methyltransferase